MRDEVRDLVVERILDGTYPAGTRLKELALAGECNVSQAPVREALRELEALGLVQSERYRGTRVRAADNAQLLEAYELRALLQERSAQLAVPCSAATLQELSAAVQNMQKSVKRGDFRSHAEAAAAFHRLIVEASHNATFLRAFDSLHWEVRGRIAVQKIRDRGVDDLQSFIDAHAVIVQQLEQGDGLGAGRGLRQLIERVVVVIESESLPENASKTAKKAGQKIPSKTVSNSARSKPRKR